MSDLNGRVRLYFRGDGRVRKVVHSEKGQGVRSVTDLSPFSERRAKQVKRMLRSFATEYLKRDPALSDDASVLSFERRLERERPTSGHQMLRSLRIMVRQSPCLPSGREDLVQELALRISAGALSWRYLKENQVAALRAVLREMQSEGLYPDYMSLDAVVTADGRTRGDVMQHRFATSSTIQQQIEDEESERESVEFLASRLTEAWDANRLIKVQRTYPHFPRRRDLPIPIDPGSGSEGKNEESKRDVTRQASS